MSTELWFVVLAAGVITYFSRALPFVVRLRESFAPTHDARMAALGPCLIAAMAANTIYEGLTKAAQAGAIMPFLVGAGFAALCMKLRRDPGLATIAGVFGWWITGTFRGWMA